MNEESDKPSIPKAGNKFLLKSGKQLIDYVDEAGFGLGFAIGNAVRLCFKSGQESDLVERKKLMDGCSWYIDHASKATHLSKDEITEIVSRITSRIERDQLGGL